jgi:hypothetical protein
VSPLISTTVTLLSERVGPIEQRLAMRDILRELSTDESQVPDARRWERARTLGFAAMPRDLPIAFDPRLGFHFYGADLCLAARQQGLKVVALDGPCAHHSPHLGLASAFEASGRLFASKWSAQLPLATSCVLIDRHGRIAQV